MICPPGISMILPGFANICLLTTSQVVGLLSVFSPYPMIQRWWILRSSVPSLFLKPLPELQRNMDNRFSLISCAKVMRIKLTRPEAKQPETTEVDLILVVLTLSGCVTAVGALAFSHYEGRLNSHSCVGSLMGLITNFDDFD